MRTRIAVVGVGRWGIHYVRDLLDHPNSQLTAIVDTSQDRLNECREKFPLDRAGVKLTRDWREVEADALVIAIPATAHHQLIASALDAGYHILSEKPLTLDPGACRELTELARARGRVLFTDHTYLFHNGVIAGKKVVAGGRLGQLRYGYSARTHLAPVRQDVDALWDLAIHDVCIFNYWLGDTPIAVSARGSTWLQPHLSDLVRLTLTYRGGFQADVHLCWLNPDKQRRLAVVGSEGTLIFDELHPEGCLILQSGSFVREGAIFRPVNQSTEFLPVEKNEPLKTVRDLFLDSIAGAEIPPGARGETATELVRVLDALSRSLERGGEIIPLD